MIGAHTFYARLMTPLALLTCCLLSVSHGLAAESVRLRLGSIPSGDSPSARDRADREIFEAFRRIHPEIELTAQRESLGSGMKLGEQAFLMAQAAGIAADVLNVNTRQVRSFAQQGFLLPLNTVMNAEEAEMWRTRIPEKLHDLVLDKDGTIWGIPYTVHGAVLYWRKDLFRGAAAELRVAGLDSGRAPRTWEELALYARILTKPVSPDRKRPRSGFGMWSGFDAGYAWTSFVWSAGGNMVVRVIYCPEDRKRNEFPKEEKLLVCAECGKDLIGQPFNWEAAFHREPGVKALQFLRDMRWTVVGEGDYAAPVLLYENAGDLYRLFGDGDLAMVLADVDLVQSAGRTDFDPAVTGVAAFPSLAPGVSSRSAITIGMWAINGHLKKDPARARAAWIYIKHQLSDEADRIRTKYRVANGEAQFVAPELLEKHFPEYLDEVDRSIIEAQKRILADGRIVPSIDNYDKIMTRILAEPIDTVMVDEQASCRDVLALAAQKTNTLLRAVPLEVRERRQKIAYVVAAIVLVILVVLLFVMGKSFADMARAAMAGGYSGHRGTGVAISLLLPAFVLVLLWKYVPLVRGTVIAFLDYRIMDNSGRFVGLENFIGVFTDPWFYHCFGITLRYVAITMSMAFVAPIILAILLSEVPRAKIFWRTLFFLPSLSSGLLILLLWKESVFDVSPGGILNKYIVPAAPYAMTAGLLTLLALAAGFVRMAKQEERFGTVKGLVAILLLTSTGLLLARHGYGISSVRVPHSWLGDPVLWMCMAIMLGAVVFLVVFRRGGHVGSGVVWTAIGLTAGVGLAAVIVHWFRTGAAGVPFFGPQKWLNDPKLALACLILPGVWAGAGPGCLIYLAALKGVPEDLYDAADVDGAGVLAKVGHVVLPTIKPLIIINFVGSFVGCFHSMGGVLIMTQGGPQGATHVLGYEVWLKAFVYLEYGYATVVGWTLGFLLIGFTIYNLRILRQMKFATTG